MSKQGKNDGSQNKVKAGFIHIHFNWGKILTFIFFLLLSTIFWFILVLRQTFESTIQVPITYINVPDSVLIKNPLPATINVSVSDKGIDLLRAYLANKKSPLEIDVRGYINSKNTLISDDQLVQLIKTKFEKTTTLLRYSPSRISLDYSVLRSKKVPVIFDGEITTKANYLLDGDIEVKPDSVIAYSSKEILNKFNVAFTANKKFEGLSSNTVINIRMKSEKNIRFEPEIVQVKIPVAEFTQKQVTVPITCLNLPVGTNVVFFPSSATISFAVALSDFNKITADDFSLDLDYQDLVQTKGGVIRLRLTGSPSYIQNISIKPESSEFIIESDKKR